MPFLPSPRRLGNLLQGPSAPRAPTIADLLGQQPVSASTDSETAARQAFADRMAAIGPARSIPGAISNIGGHIANAITGRREISRAKDEDKAATQEQEASRSRIAEMLSGAGVAPEQAVGMASASPQDNALVMNLMGMKQQQEAAAAEQAYRQGRDQVDDDRFGQTLDLKRQAFQADRSDAATANSLQQRAIALQEKDREIAQRQALAKQGHIETLVAGKSPEEQALILADTDGYIAAQQKAQADEFAVEVNRILEANPELAESEDGMRQAQNIALDLVKSATDPVLGGTATYNLATGQGAPIETPRPELDRFQAGGEPITIQDMAGEIGAIPFAEDVIAKTLGQASPGLVNEARTKAASQLDFVKQKAISAFATSARPPVIEQQRIESLFPSKGIFDSEERARQQLSHLHDMAVATHNDYVDLVESGQMPVDQESELRGKIAELRQVVNMLPGQGAAQPSAPVSQSPDLGADPLGLFQ